MSDLRKQFGEIDIYLFDQLLRGRVAAGARIVDVGCGSGRNLVYLLQAGYQVFGLDPDASHLYAANENSHTIVEFRIDQASGKLAPTGQIIETGSPSCIAFATR